MITLPAEILQGHKGRDESFAIQLRPQDGGDAYSGICVDGVLSVPATLRILDRLVEIPVAKMGSSCGVARILACWQQTQGYWKTKGFVRRQEGWHEVSVMIVPVREEFFSRTRGLFETDALADKCVLTVGQGSGGAPISFEFGKLGVSQILVDHDRLEVGNVVRHLGGLSDVGRYKTKLMAAKLRDKNPYAEIETHEIKIDWETEDIVRELVRGSDLTICATDDHVGRVVLNRVCVEQEKPLIVAGAFRRAYGGQILFIEPGRTPCYQCFLQANPERLSDREISSPQQAERYAYSDRPVPIEPGLSTDIAPISLMVVKLAIQYLLRGKPTTLRSLDEDLVAPWYLWINRRESGTDYEQLEPLEFNVDGLHVLRWYGIEMKRDPACPCCGNFLGAITRKEGLIVGEEDLASFAGEKDK